jgi:hypothetical protein
MLWGKESRVHTVAQSFHLVSTLGSEPAKQIGLEVGDKKTSISIKSDRAFKSEQTITFSTI